MLLHNKTSSDQEVDIKQKLNMWDWSTCKVPICVGDGHQSLRWLGFAACARVAFEMGEVPAKYVPQGISYEVAQKLIPYAGREGQLHQILMMKTVNCWTSFQRWIF